jgi:hypothetical protein
MMTTTVFTDGWTLRRTDDVAMTAATELALNG